MISIILHIYFFLKRRKNLGIVADIPLDFRYDEIGNFEIPSTNIQDLRENVQEPANIIDLSGLEGRAYQISSFEKK